MDARRFITVLVAMLVAIGLIILALSYSGLIEFRSAVSSWILELLTALSVQLLNFYNSRSSTKSEVRAALAEHYNRLNANVFTPLRTATFFQRTPEWWGTSQLSQILFVWDASQIEQSDFWDAAKQHLGRDIPGWTQRLEEIEHEGATYNKEIREFRDSNQQLITEKLSKVTEVTPQILLRNSVTLPNVMQVIEMSWIQLQEKWPDRIAEGLENLKIFQLKPRVDEKDGEHWLFFDSCCVGRGLGESQTKEITQIFIDSVKDESTLRAMHGFVQTKRELEDKGRRLTNEIGKVVHSINDDQYSTVVDCCKKIRGQY